MICPECKKSLPNGSSVCGFCGYRLDKGNESKEKESKEEKVTECIEKNDITSGEDIVLEEKEENVLAVQTENNTQETEKSKDNSSDIVTVEKKEKKSEKVSTKPSEKEKKAEEEIKPEENKKKSKKIDKNTQKAIEKKQQLKTAQLINERKLKEMDTPIEKYYRKYKPMSTAGFFFTELVLFIPVLNVILLLIWSFRRNSNSNLKAYSRSRLIWILLRSLLLVAGFAVIVVWLSSSLQAYAESVQAILNNIQSFFQPVADAFNSVVNAN